MIRYHLSLKEDENLIAIELDGKVGLIEELRTLEAICDVVWLAADDNEKGEILITENLEVIINAVKNEQFKINWENDDFFMQLWHSYEDAYKVALAMREINELCYAVDGNGSISD